MCYVLLMEEELGPAHTDTIKSVYWLNDQGKRPRASHHLQTNIHSVKLLYFISFQVSSSLVFFFLLLRSGTHKHCSSFSFLSGARATVTKQVH
jgi:hypothetical protein